MVVRPSEPEAEAVGAGDPGHLRGRGAFDFRSVAAGVVAGGRTGPRQQLTDWEIEVPAAARGGFSNQKIGERLLTSATTVSFTSATSCASSR